MKKQKVPDVTRFSGEVLNVALKMRLEWGENFLTPIHKRIMKMYPDLTNEDADVLSLWCAEVKKYAFALVEKDYPLAMENKEGTAMAQVQEKYPQIDKENLSSLYNQGMYYAWHG